MAAIPSGSLVFTGYGDSGTMRFVSPSGTLLGQPVSAPQPGSGVSAIKTLVGSNAIAIIGGNTPNFGSTGTGTFNSTGTFRAQYVHGGGTSYAGFGGGRDDAGCFYSTKSNGSNLLIFKYDADCALVASWTVAMGFTVGNVGAMGVNGAGTVAYVNVQKFSGATAAEIYAISLAGAGSSSGVFASDATSTSLQGQGCVIGLTNGDVIIAWRHANTLKRYNSSGTLQTTYTVPSGMTNPMQLAYGFSPATTFWVGGYNSGGATFSTTTVAEYNIATGAILNQFEPEDGSFEFDSSFTVIGAAIGATAPTTPTPVLVNSTPCCGDTVSPHTGSATGPVLKGTGWTPQCTGGGAVESAAALTDAQNWDTLTERGADVWFELVLAKFPATAGTTTYRWAKTPLADTGSFKEGRLVSCGRVKRAASTVDGDYTVGGFSVVVDDSDALIRTLLEQETTTEYFLNREAGLYLLSPAGRAAGLTKRTLMRGWVSNVQTLKGHQVRIDVSDIVGSQFAGFNLERTIPSVLLGDLSGLCPDELKTRVLPIYAGELSDYGAVDANGNPAARGLVPAFDIGAINISDPDNTGAPVSTAPTPPVITASSVTGTTGQETCCYGATLITPYGESLMSNIVTCNGASVRNVSNYNTISGTFVGGVGDVNKVRIWYGPTAAHMVGWLDEANYNGSGIFGYFDGAAAWPTATRDEIDTVKTMDAPATPPDNNWHIMAVCLGYRYNFLNFYASNLADGTSPTRVAVGASYHGSQIIGPDDPQWPFSTPYIVRNGIRFTGYLSTGPLLVAHQQGTITQAVNLCGPTDATGLVTNQAFRQLLWLLNEHVAKNGGTGYRTGDYWPLEAYANGESLFATTLFTAAQDASAANLGNAMGYLGMMALTEPITVREFVRRFCRTFGCRLAHNHHGQVFPFLVDAPVDATAGRAIREHIEILDIGEPTLAHDEIMNRQGYSYHVDPEGEEPFRNAGLTAEDATSIAAHTPGGIVGGTDRRGVKPGDDREMFYTNDTATADDVIARELARRARRPRYLPVTVDLMGLGQEIAAQVRATHREGLGSGGDVLMPALVLEHETDADSLDVTLLLQDLRTLPAAAFEVMRASDDGALLVASDDGAVLVASL